MFDASLENIGARRGVSKGVEDGCNPQAALWVSGVAYLQAAEGWAWRREFLPYAYARKSGERETFK
jgi:hypothetical protein